jgi:hypothetical protein
MIKTLLAFSLAALTPKPLLKVAVIDTGFSAKNDAVPQCPTGAKDFTGEGLEDHYGHGTNISGLIDKHAKGSNYCQIILKYYTVRASEDNSIKHELLAFRYAIDQKVDFINFSSTGSLYSKEEYALIKEALDKGITVVVPAGNEDINLDKNCKVYPACLDSRLVVVSRNDFDAKIRRNYGYGKIVDFYEDGYMQSALGVAQSGTSQATAITTGKLIKQRDASGKSSRVSN